MTDHITVQGQDGTFAAYIARPKTSPASAVIVLQELFGVNADIRKHCDELAEQGYLAVAPDLYWRQEPGVDLNVTSQADWDHGLRLYQAYDRDAGVRDIKDTIDAVRSLPDCNGKVALLGYCLGALMVFMTAVRNDGIDAAVWYHSADTDKYLGEVNGLHAPILMHLAEEDEFISKTAQARLGPHLLRNQMRRCTAIWGSVMLSPAITENTTTPPRLTLPTVERVNSSTTSCDDCRTFSRSNPVDSRDLHYLDRNAILRHCMKSTNSLAQTWHAIAMSSIAVPQAIGVTQKN
jgi:carboxymethylenebutenolidase